MMERIAALRARSSWRGDLFPPVAPRRVTLALLRVPRHPTGIPPLPRRRRVWVPVRVSESGHLRWTSRSARVGLMEVRESGRWTAAHIPRVRRYFVGQSGLT